MIGVIKFNPFVNVKTLFLSTVLLLMPLVSQKAQVKPYIMGSIIAGYGRYLSAGINPMTPVQMSIGPGTSMGGAPSAMLLEDAVLLEYYVRRPGVWLARALCEPAEAAGSLDAGCSVFLACFNATPPADEKEIIREAWRQAFGIDVWYPYYKAKEIEGWVKNRFSVKIFKLKGEPEFEKNKVRIIFKTRF